INFNEEDKKKKPNLILFYNKNKGGVNVHDYLCNEYNTKRNTIGWPHCLFNTFYTLFINRELLYAEEIILETFEKSLCNDNKLFRNLSFQHPSTSIAVKRRKCYFCVTNEFKETNNLCKICPVYVCKNHSNIEHTGEVIALSYDTSGRYLISGSFDNTMCLWDVHSGKKIQKLIGHDAEISNCVFNYDGSLIASSSMDYTTKLWYPGSGKCVTTHTDHANEVIDITFSLDGDFLASASCDRTVMLYNVKNNKRMFEFKGHTDETCRLWDTNTGKCVQVLKGHTDDVFGCSFNYDGDYIITGSKDNTCRIWKSL
ncbi:hypothetical protein A3Q56_06931, partial [Intoshia linei]